MESARLIVKYLEGQESVHFAKIIGIFLIIKFNFKISVVWMLYLTKHDIKVPSSQNKTSIMWPLKYI